VPESKEVKEGGGGATVSVLQGLKVSSLDKTIREKRAASQQQHKNKKSEKCCVLRVAFFFSGFLFDVFSK
jgi:hypothetical protein